MYKKIFNLLILSFLILGTFTQLNAQTAITPKHSGTIATFSGSWTGSSLIQGSSAGNDYMILNANNASIQSPNMDFTGKRAIIYLQLKSEPTVSTAAMLSVEISTNGGVSWDNLDEITASDANFSTIIVNASAYTGSQNMIRLVTYNNSTNNAIGIDDIVIIGYDEPTVQASALQFSCQNNKSLKVAWTKGNGNRTAVFMLRASSAGVPNIEDGLAYSVSSPKGINTTRGSQLGGSGYYCVYNDTGSSVLVGNLTANSKYWFRVYSYSSDSLISEITLNYNPNTAASNPSSITTLASASSFPLPVLTNLNASNITTTAASVSSMLNGSDDCDPAMSKGFIWSETSLNSNPLIGGNSVNRINISNSDTGSFNTTFTGLPSGVSITYKSFGLTLNSNVGYSSTGTFTTLAIPPTSAPLSLQFSNIDTNRMHLSWTKGDGSKRIVVARPSGSTRIAPSNATGYAVNSNSYSDALNPLTGLNNKVVFNDSSSNFTLTGLSANTIYEFDIYEYNGDNASANYLSSFLSGNQSTLASQPSAASNLSFSNTTDSSTLVSWTNGSGSNRILVVRLASTPKVNPTNGTNYPVNSSSFSDVPNLLTGAGNSGNVVVYNANGSSINVTGLTNATTYSFDLYEYNGSNSTINYAVATTANKTTLGIKPTVKASAMVFGTITTNSIQLSWTNGNGNKRIVVARPSSSAIGSSSNAIAYSVNSASFADFSNDSIALNNRVIYNGNGQTVTVSGLNIGTSYTFDIYEYNGSGSSTVYSDVYSDSRTTLDAQPTVLSSNLVFSNITQSSISLAWTKGNGSRRIVVARDINTSRTAPANATQYTVNSSSYSNVTNDTTGSGNIVVYNGTGSTVNVIELTPVSRYAFDIYEYNGSGLSTNYSSNLSGNEMTLAAEPTNQASNVNFTNVSKNSFTVNWTKGADAVYSMVIVKASAAVDAFPTDGSIYLASTIFGNGNELGTGNYISYLSSGNSLNLTGLTEGTTYYVAVVSYNSSASTLQNYLLTNPATGSQMAQKATFYSKGSLNPESLSSWTSSRDGSGINPIAFNSVDNDFIIQDGHTMTTNTTWNFGSNGSSKLKIENGGILKANHLVSISSLDSFIMESNAKYIQNNTGGFNIGILNGKESFDANSTFEIQKSPSTGPSQPSAGFGHLIVNMSADPGYSIQMGGGTLQIKGNFEMQNFPLNRDWQFTNNTSLNLNIEGDLIVSNGGLDFASQSGNTYLIASIGGDFIQNGGIVKSTSTTALNLSLTGSNNSISLTGGTYLPNNINLGIASAANYSSLSNLSLGSAKTLTIDGTLNMDAYQILPAGNNANITINGTVLTADTNGFSGKTTTCISSTNNPTVSLLTGSTIHYNANGNQSVSARSDYGNIEISGTGIKSIEPGFRMTFSGNLTTNNAFVLKSDSTSTASIGELPNTASITGEITVERFIPSRRAYRFLASPVSTSDFIKNNWQKGAFITGNGGSSNGFDVGDLQGLQYPSMFVLNATTQSWDSIPNTNATNLTQGMGYRMFVRGDRTIDLNSNYSPATNTILSATGTHTPGNKTFNTSSSPALTNQSNGYTMIGNPFPSTIDWNTVSKSNISTSYWTWRAQGGTNNRGAYVNYNASGMISSDGNVNKNIESGNAIIVQTTASNPELIIKESDKTAAIQGSQILGKAVVDEVLRITINEQDSVFADGLVIYATNEAQNTFETFDTEKWINPGFTMYSYTSDNKKVSIQGVPEFIDQRTIQLGMEKTENRTYTMKFDGFDLTDFEISLKDKYTGKSTPISAVKSYKFDINNDINSKASNRFSLLFNKKSTGIEDINSSKQLILYPNPAQDVINLSLLTANIQQCDFAISNQIGQLVLEGKLDFSSDQTQQLNIENLPVGMYLIHINGKSGLHQVLKFIK